MEQRIIDLLNNLERIRNDLSIKLLKTDAAIVTEAIKEICLIHADPVIPKPPAFEIPVELLEK